MSEAGKKKRTFLRVAIGTCVLIVALFFGMRLYVTRGFPQVDGTIELPGLDAPVTIIRDEWGVPHIYARTDHDALFAQGFVHGQDRRFQMEGISRLVFGRLSEIAGPSSLDQDVLFRSYGFEELALKIADGLPDHIREGLEAYCEGVNAAVDYDPQRLAFEFRMIKRKPEPWRVEDVIGVYLLNSWMLSMNFIEERIAADLSSSLSKDEIEVLFNFEEPTDWGMRVPEPGPGEASALISMIELAGMPASNNWVVGPRRSKGNMPMLANDPHLGLTLPCIWYEVHVESQSFRFAGFSVPGAPFIAIGRNERVAWGFTNVMTDNADLVLEKVKPATAEVLTPGGWIKLDSRKTTIKVKDSPDVEAVLYQGPNGPIVRMPGQDALDDQGMGIAYALRWTGRDERSSFEAFENMVRAKNSEELIAATGLFDSLSQNLVYADLDGHFGWKAFGRVPVRQGYTGKYPVNGWEPDKAWIGYVPYEDMPASRDPESGFVATTNADSDDGLGFMISTSFVRPYRFNRINQLLSAQGTLGLDDMAKIQGDTLSLQAPIYLSVLFEELGDDSEFKPLIDLLRDWDRDLGPGSAPAALYSVFLGNLWQAWVGDELGEYFEPFAGRMMLLDCPLDDQVGDPANTFWDDRGTSDKVETRHEIFRLAMSRTKQGLASLMGPDRGRWSWGAIHGAVFEHPAGHGGLASRLLNFGPLPVGGDAHTVNANAWVASGDYRVVAYPSMRFLFDAADPDHPRSVITTGQSGHPGDEHYSDQAPLWAAVQYKTQLWARPDIEQAAKATLILKPQGDEEER